MPAFVTILAATLVSWLADAAVGIVGRCLVALGIGAVTATGLNALMSAALSYVGTSAQVQAAMNAVGVDWFISTIFSAITTRAALAGLSSDSLTFWTMRQKVGT